MRSKTCEYFCLKLNHKKSSVGFKKLILLSMNTLSVQRVRKISRISLAAHLSETLAIADGVRWLEGRAKVLIETIQF